MGFLDTIKRAMGFSPGEDDEVDVEGIDATVTPLRMRVQAPNPPAAQQSEQESVNTDVAPETAWESASNEPSFGRPDASVIFDRVVDMFNLALPEFLRDSVDPEKERKNLFDALDASMKEYFINLEKNVERRLQSRHQAESLKLQEQIEDLRQKAKKEEECNSNAKNLQLSAERQKRALSERVHELEKQLATLEAENEQYILENKTMANKLRLAAVTDSESIPTQSADPEMVAGLEKEIERLKEALEQAKVKDELGVAMVNDLNSKAAEARKTATEKEQLAQSLQSELEQANGQLAAMTARLTKAQEDLQVVREVQEQVRQLEENQRVNDAELSRQRDELLEKDELLKVKDADILTKNTTLRIKDETIRRLEDQADSLRKSIETVQFEKTQSESALMSEIERLKLLKGIQPAQEPNVNMVGLENDDVPAADNEGEQVPDLTLDLPDLVNAAGAPAQTQKPRRGRPPKVKPAEEPEVTSKTRKAMEDDNDFSLLDSTDWLIATPVQESSSKPKKQRKQKADTSDDTFGYKEPVRQEPPDNPAQMLLW